MSNFRDKADDFIEKYTEEVFDYLFGHNFCNESMPMVTINNNTFDLSVYNNEGDILHGYLMVNEYINDGKDCEQWEFSFDNRECGEGAILQFCLHEDSKPTHIVVPEQKKEKYILKPANPNLEQENPQMWNVFLDWQEQEWFKKLESAMNLDSYLIPCRETINIYKEKAAKHSLIFVLEEIK